MLLLLLFYCFTDSFAVGVNAPEEDLEFVWILAELDYIHHIRGDYELLTQIIKIMHNLPEVPLVIGFCFCLKSNSLSGHQLPHHMVTVCIPGKVWDVFMYNF